ncbi:MAG: bifunctional phosphoglucose/phosphomannose isomerase [Candidatus Omnitrophica bacterium]|nr:bifunctional phosphoglucose/phosphomannose isomerase [Candidatus Omnitrophota bacterium]
MNPLDSLAVVSRTDRSGMLRLIEQMPLQFCRGFEEGRSLPVRLPRPPQEIAFVGMGGSAISGDLVKALLTRESRVPFAVHRTYGIPGYIGPKTLVIGSSYSGDTEETLSAYAQARKRKAMLCVVTSGGRLSRLARKEGVPWAKIPTGLPPRAALGYLAAAPLGILNRLKLSSIDQRQMTAAAGVLGRNIKSWLPQVPASRNLAKRLARLVRGRLCVVYGADGGWEAVVARWRGQLAENSKALASAHLFPEMNHNEVSGWEFPPKLLKRCAVIFLKDRSYHPRVLKRMEITQRIIRESGARVIPVEVAGPRPLGRMLSMIALGDHLSVYLGVLHRVDPTPVERVADLKHQLRRSR